MELEELRAWVAEIAQDISFIYQGKCGSICPFAEDDIALCYNEEAVTVHSVDEVFTTPFIEGKTLAEMCEKVTFD